MSSHPFSSLVMRELLKEIVQIGEGIRLDDADWANGIAAKYFDTIRDLPVVYLTEEENLRARGYLTRYKESGLDIADRATLLIRGKHAKEMREVLKAKQDDRLASAGQDSTEEIQYTLPSNDSAPTSFKEWFAVAQVWRLTVAMAEISFQNASLGTPGCFLGPLPKIWEDKLNECMQVTDTKAVVPTPRGYGLPVTRNDINSVLPTFDGSADVSGLLNDGILDRWFRIVVSNRNQRKPESTVYIHPESLDLASATPQQVTENVLLVNDDIELILFPTIIKQQDHCILLAAFPHRNLIAVYDSKGPESTAMLQRTLPWIKRYSHEPKEDFWQVMWMECPQQGEEDACGIFMCINALLISSEKGPVDVYSNFDTLFLGRYIAATICMGELPQLF